MTGIVIIGGGPAGYEAALVAAQLGAEVTVIERDGMGGASVLTDCVPSKTLIAAAGMMTSVRDSAVLGLQGAELATVGLDLEEMPEHLVVVGSGVTGAEFASGYLEAGVPVTLVSSHDQVLPGEDSDAAEVLEQVFQSRGGRIAEKGRAARVTRTEKGVVVE